MTFFNYLQAGVLLLAIIFVIWAVRTDYVDRAAISKVLRRALARWLDAEPTLAEAIMNTVPAPRVTATRRVDNIDIPSRWRWVPPNNGDPWAGERAPSFVIVTDVKDGWVRYYSSWRYPDQTIKLDDFRRYYTPA